MHWLAEVLSLVESKGRWPQVLPRGYTALVLKEGLPGALNMRPLMVLLVVYRLWAGLRLERRAVAPAVPAASQSPRRGFAHVHLLPCEPQPSLSGWGEALQGGRAGRYRLSVINVTSRSNFCPAGPVRDQGYGPW